MAIPDCVIPPHSGANRRREMARHATRNSPCHGVTRPRWPCPTSTGGPMKKLAGFLVIAAFASTLTVANAEEEKKPDATLRLHGGSIAAGIGFSWGSGTLSY